MHTMSKGMIRIPEGMDGPWNQGKKPGSTRPPPTSTAAGAAATTTISSDTGTIHLPSNSANLTSTSTVVASASLKLERYTREELLQHYQDNIKQYASLVHETKMCILNKKKTLPNVGIILSEPNSEGMFAIFRAPCRREAERFGMRLIWVDLGFALEKKIELGLWNDLFKVPIDGIRQLSRVAKDPREQQQHYLAKCLLLELASHFYYRLLSSICLLYNVSLDSYDGAGDFAKWRHQHRPAAATATGGVHNLRSPMEMLTRRVTIDWAWVQQGQCSPLHEATGAGSSSSGGGDLPLPGGLVQDFMSDAMLQRVRSLFQHCLIHLGDLERYRNSAQRAYSCYFASLVLNPNLGHTYNQIGLLSPRVDASSCAVVSSSTVTYLHWWYHAVRALYCTQPFVKAQTNLHDLASKVPSCVPALKGKIATPDGNVLVMSFLQFHACLHLHKDYIIAQECFAYFQSHATVCLPTLDSDLLVRMMAIHLAHLYRTIQQLNGMSTVSSVLEETLESPDSFITLNLSHIQRHCGVLLHPNALWSLGDEDSSTAQILLSLLLLLRAHTEWVRCLSALMVAECSSPSTSSSSSAAAAHGGLVDIDNKYSVVLLILLLSHRHLRAFYDVPNSHIWNLYPFQIHLVDLLNTVSVQQQQQGHSDAVQEWKKKIETLESDTALFDIACKVPEIDYLKGFLPLNLPIQLPALQPAKPIPMEACFTMESLSQLYNRSAADPTASTAAALATSSSASDGVLERFLLFVQLSRQCGNCRFSVNDKNKMFEMLNSVRWVAPPVENIVPATAAVVPPPLSAPVLVVPQAAVSESSMSQSSTETMPAVPVNHVMLDNSATLTTLSSPPSTTTTMTAMTAMTQSVKSISSRRQNVALQSLYKSIATPDSNSGGSANVEDASLLLQPTTSPAGSVEESQQERGYPQKKPDKSIVKHKKDQFSHELPPRFQRIAAQQANKRSFQGPYKATPTGAVQSDLSIKESELDEETLEATAQISQPNPTPRYHDYMWNRPPPPPQQQPQQQQRPSAESMVPTNPTASSLMGHYWSEGKPSHNGGGSGSMQQGMPPPSFQSGSGYAEYRSYPPMDFGAASSSTAPNFDLPPPSNGNGNLAFPPKETTPLMQLFQQQQAMRAHWQSATTPQSIQRPNNYPF